MLLCVSLIYYVIDCVIDYVIIEIYLVAIGIILFHQEKQ
jgi:hypothetical protein